MNEWSFQIRRLSAASSSCECASNADSQAKKLTHVCPTTHVCTQGGVSRECAKQDTEMYAMPASAELDKEDDSKHGHGVGASGRTGMSTAWRQDRWKEGIDTALLFLSLPTQVFVVLLLEALNSYRNFGLRFVQYNYFVNEFGLTDTETGSLLGLKSTLDVIFAIMGSLATDALGVRKTALLALSMAFFGRFLLAFGRSRTELYVACLFFSPFGEAFLSVGLYKVPLDPLALYCRHQLTCSQTSPSVPLSPPPLISQPLTA